MRRFAIAIILALVLPTGLTACGDDCKTLSNITCSRAGEDSDECQRIRERAERPSAEDRRACSLVLGIVNDFTSQQ